MADVPVNADAASAPYRVLARKYRPTTFAALIGQEAMVRTLTNALAAGRLPHAFVLTGVRGVGKTTTARIIARALNCVGPDGTGGPTAAPCRVCEQCRAIADDRHVDVIEMDAASRTGVDDIRELIEGVRYRPVSGRFKVYIIDEVHMLSKNAFNALLKTLEEPPEHVRFVFATTEVRKVPITVLSRCMRFDLRRIDADTLFAHLADVARQEGAEVSEPALRLIARAADGSARDGLSLLDQAIAHAGGAADDETVRAMLGLADRTRTFDLFEAAMRGAVADALAVLAEQYAAGADPATILEDLLEIVHWLTRVKAVPDAAEGPQTPEAERVRGRAMAERLSMAEITRAWQMLLKGLGEVRIAPSPVQAAEMVVVRLAYAAGLPTPAEAIRSLDGGPAAGAPTTAPSPPSRPAPRARAGLAPDAEEAPLPAPEPEPPAPTEARHAPADFEAAVALVGEAGELILRAHLVNDVHLVAYEPGRIEIRRGPGAPDDVARKLARVLGEATGERWLVTDSQAEGAPTLGEQRRERIAGHPVVQAVMETFPGARIGNIREPKAETPESAPQTAESTGDGGDIEPG